MQKEEKKRLNLGSKKSGADLNRETISISYWDSLLPHVTTDSLSKVLAHFPLKLEEGKDEKWLATSVRRALAFSMPNDDENPSRKSNADTRDELANASRRALALKQRLFEKLSPEAEQAIVEQASPTHLIHATDKLEQGHSADTARFYRALRELNWLSSYLKDVAEGLQIQQPRWKEADLRTIRIRRGLCLAPVFCPPSTYTDFQASILETSTNVS